MGATYKEIKKQISYIPKRYYKYKKLWNKQFGERLAEHVPWDHAVDLELGTHLKFFPTYKLTETKNQALKEFIQENLRLGRIRLSQSSAGYPVLFTPKKNGKLQLCINYWQLNSITKKDRYLLLLISEIQNK